MAQNKTTPAHKRVLRYAKDALRAIDVDTLRNIEIAARRLATIRGKVVTRGVGKSGFIAAKAAANLSSLGIPAVSINPTDALHGDTGLIESTDAVLALFGRSCLRCRVEGVKTGRHEQMAGVQGDLHIKPGSGSLTSFFNALRNFATVLNRQHL